jgi:uncharacterized repeat protein (TIGR01451 family)
MRTQEIRKMEKRVEMYRRLLIWNIVFLLGLLCWGSVSGQSYLKRTKQVQSSGTITKVIKNINDSTYVIGYNNFSTRSGFNLAKLNKNLDTIWTKKYYGSGLDVLQDIISTDENGYILVSASNSPISGNKTRDTLGSGFDIWVIKVDSIGNILNQMVYGGSAQEYLMLSIYNFTRNIQQGSKILKSKTDGYFLFTNSESGTSGNKIGGAADTSHLWSLKINDTLGIVNQKSLTSSKFNETMFDAIISSDNNFLISSNLPPIAFDSGRRFSVKKIDTNFNILWEKIFYGENDNNQNIIETKDSGFVIATICNSTYEAVKRYTSYGREDILVTKIDKNGNKIWNKIYGGNESDKAPCIYEWKNELIICCQSSSPVSGNKFSYNDMPISEFSNYWILILDSLGNKTSEFDIFNGGSSGTLASGDPKLISNYDKLISLFGMGNGSINIYEYSLKPSISKIQGSIFPDFNSNCLYNKPTEYNIPKILIHNKIENTYAVTTDSIYTMYLFDRDTAVLKIINLDSNLYVACGKDSIVVDMTGKKDTSGIDFPIRSNKTGHCINITSFSSGLLRPGRWGDYQLNYQNNAFDTAYNAYIEIEVDTAAIDSIKSPYSFTLTGNVLRFNLGHVRPFGFSSVTYSIKLKTSVIIGSSHCHRAKVFPICNLYPSAVYDSSEIQPMMRCLPNDTVEFTLKNIGLKDQKDWGHSIIYVDELILKKDSFKLTVGNSRVFKYKLDTNKVFTAEVFNSNFHPVTPILIRHNDLCANKRPMIPSNPALNFSRHDEAKEYEEACTIVLGSYDPNMKSVLPVGMFSQHYTATGTELKYRLDFQNTGTDTAFKVVLIDTLSADLDIASFVPGASSHPYSVEFGGRAVKFIFDPIALVDSFKNEPLSHGYVHFKIKPITGIKPKTKIENKADIYFDYNAPITTNTVFNTIFDTIQIYVPKGGSSIVENDKTSVIVFPNPTTDKFFIQMSEPVKDLSIEIYDMQGRLTKSMTSINSHTLEVSAEGMTKGIYHIRVMSGEKLVVVKKVMVE